MNFVIPATNEYSVYFLIGIINSSLINYLFATKFLNLAIKADYIKQILFPKPSKKQISEMEALTKKILLAKKQGGEIKLLEKKIDLMVYHLYKLTYEEAKIIDGELSEEDFEKYKL